MPEGKELFKYIHSFLPKKNKGIIYTWFFSYAIVLIFAITVISFIYMSAYGVVREEVNTSNMSVLNQIRQSTDNILSDMTEVNVEMSLNANVENLINESHWDNKTLSYDLYKIQKDVTSYGISKNSLDDFFVYLKNFSTIVSKNGISDSKSFFEVYYDDGTITYEKWLEVIKNSKNNEYNSIVKNDGYGNMSESIMKVYSLPLNVSKEKEVYLCSVVSKSKFERIVIDSMGADSAEISIFTENNNEIFSTVRNASKGGLSFDDLTKKEGSVKNDDGITLYLSSEVDKCKYIAYIPKKEYWEKLIYVRNVLVGGIFFLILGGVVITILLLKYNYKPVKKLMKLLSDFSSSGLETSNSNEYELMENVIRDTFEESKELKYAVEQEKERNKCSVISAFLKGRESSIDDIFTFFEKYGIELLSDRFAVLIYKCENIEDYYKKYERINNSEKDELLKLIIQKLVNEKNSNFGKGLVINMEGYFVCLFNCFDSEDDENRIANEIAFSSKETINEYLNLDFTVGFSGIYEDFYGIKEAYDEALVAMDHRMIFGKGKCISYAEVSNRNNFKLYYPSNLEQKIINYVKIGDEKEAKEIFDELFENNTKSDIVSLYTAKCLMFNMLGTIFKAMGEIQADDEEIANIYAIQRLFRCDTIFDFKSDFDEILRGLCSYAKQRTAFKKFNIYDSVIPYIHENYLDYNLNMTSLARKYGFEPKYFSKVFKKQTGEKVTDYINKYRIEKAKEIINNDTDMKLESVSQMVGFSSFRTFIRNFNRYEGITPGDFKSMAKNL